MSSWAIGLAYFIPSFILVAGMIDDLRTQKVHNWLFLTCLSIALVFVLVVKGFSALPYSLLGMLCALACFLPFVLIGFFGAGDMKLYMAFGLATDWNTAFQVFVLSIFWGAAFGIVKSVISGNFFNIFRKLRGKNVEKIDREGVLKIPYTVALLLGWFTFVSFGVVA